MPELATATIATADLLVGLTATMTTCVALMIWVGLLGRASRATMLWTFAFLLGLLAAYSLLAAGAVGTDVLLHPVGFGFLCGMPTVIWSGLRAAQGKRSYAWIGFAQSALSVAILWLTTDMAIGFAVFRWLFFASAIGAVLGAIEVVRGAFRGSRFGMPLVVAAAILLLLSAIGAAGTVAGASTATDLFFVRGIVIALTIYAISATVSVLFLSNRRPGARDALEALDAFLPEWAMRAIVRERLLRARNRGEQTWTFVDLQLDDTTDLREATGEAAFATATQRFEGIVAAVFPAEADLCRVTPGHVTVFASQPVGAVREYVRSILNEISLPAEQAPTSLRITASAGLVSVDTATDTYETLVAAAAAQTAAAQEAGGDRWRRADADHSAS